MASTNKTTHYNLSQYIGTDKPTYLVDYNTDMSNIDAGIYSAKSESEVNTASIGTLASLDTTAKTDLVSAVNEVNTKTNSIGNLSNLTTEANTNLVSAINEVDSHADTNNQNIGTMVNLETTVKTSLVGAINEVNTKTGTNATKLNDFEQLFNLNTFKTYNNNDSDFSNKVDIVDVNVASCNINIATNNDGSLFKIYGRLRFQSLQTTGYIRLKNTGINPTNSFNIYAGILTANKTDSNYNVTSDVNVETLYINSDGSIDLKIVAPIGIYRQFTLVPCLYFAKDFGDIPIQ